MISRAPQEGEDQCHRHRTANGLGEERGGENGHEERRQFVEHGRIGQHQVVDGPEVGGDADDAEDRSGQKERAIARTAEERNAAAGDENARHRQRHEIATDHLEGHWDLRRGLHEGTHQREAQR
jgi:hypothetical protein